MRFLIALMLLILSPGLAYAQALSCRIPAQIGAPRPEVPKPGDRRVSSVEGYTLALSWSPEFCYTHKDSDTAKTQCDGEMGHFGFILHGLWPEGVTAQYPQWCEAAATVPEGVVRGQLCSMPSVQLIQHEWAKHGSCAFADPAAYFKAASTMYGAIRYPNMAVLSRKRMTVQDFTQAFAAANRGITPAMLRVQTADKGWLEEVHLCLGKDYHPRPCPAYAARSNGRQNLRISQYGLTALPNRQ